MKIVNLILGLATAIILSSLINLGIRAFYPEPVSPYENREYTKPELVEKTCTPNDETCWEEVNRVREEQAVRQAEYEKQDKEYRDAMRGYNANVFVIANIVGVLIFIGGFYVMFSTSIATQAVPIGIMLSGLFGIMYGYSRGWDSTNDQLKFFVGLAIAGLVIGGSIWLVERYQRKVKQAGQGVPLP